MSDDRHDEERPTIKVTDRRLFDAEGNFRSDESGPAEPTPEAATDAAPESTNDEAAESVSDAAPEAPADSAEESPPAPAPVPPPAAEESVPPVAAEPPDVAAEPAATSGDATDRGAVRLDPPGEAGPAPGGAAGPARGPSELPRDLVGFVESQYYETLLYMGAIEHPQTGQVMEDLELAQYKIDLLSMLQEKTEGNRTPEESKIFEDVLYQLRMVFLQKRKVAKL